MNPKTCSCGSELVSYWVNDARGIPLAKVCDECEKEKLSKFRKDVLTDSNYECDEPIEEDY
jgi:hypothetical protein